jgi:hypothetical protein
MMRVLRDADKRLESSPHPICLFNFPADAVTEIIIGWRTPDQLRDQLISLFAAFPKAGLFQATEHRTRYALLIEALGPGR